MGIPLGNKQTKKKNEKYLWAGLPPYYVKVDSSSFVWKCFYFEKKLWYVAFFQLFELNIDST